MERICGDGVRRRSAAVRAAALLIACSAAFIPARSAVLPGSGDPAGGSLTVVAVGDAEEPNGVLRACGTYITNMHTGQHDAGKFDLLFFLGDSFGPTGLNIPAGDVRKTADALVEPFRTPVDELGRGCVHALPGEHDYYARNGIEESRLLGLVKIEEFPIGLTNRGNARAASLGEWTYHAGLPSASAFPIGPGAPDSVQFIFFDTALPLRTPESAWHPALDALRAILLSDRSRPHLVWRIFCAHHPFVSAGEHAGYTAWDDESGVVEYVPPCDRDSSALSWVRNTLDPEDLCAARYRALVDSLKCVIRDGGVKIQCAIAAHDHSLQLLDAGAGPGDPFPSIQIISGAASTPARVRFPSPPSVYTSAMTDPSAAGESLPGFVRISFSVSACTVVFYNANNGDPIDMGAGTRTFRVSPTGLLTGSQ